MGRACTMGWVLLAVCLAPLAARSEDLVAEILSANVQRVDLQGLDVTVRVVKDQCLLELARTYEKCRKAKLSDEETQKELERTYSKHRKDRDRYLVRFEIRNDRTRRISMPRAGDSALEDVYFFQYKFNGHVKFAHRATVGCRVVWEKAKPKFSTYTIFAKKIRGIRAPSHAIHKRPLALIPERYEAEVALNKASRPGPELQVGIHRIVHYREKLYHDQVSCEEFEGLIIPPKKLTFYTRRLQAMKLPKVLIDFVMAQEPGRPGKEETPPDGESRSSP